jgi:hypothetical protein
MELSQDPEGLMQRTKMPSPKHYEAPNRLQLYGEALYLSPLQFQFC